MRLSCMGFGVKNKKSIPAYMWLTWWERPDGKIRLRDDSLRKEDSTRVVT